MRSLRSLAGAALLFVASAFSTSAQHLGDVSLSSVQATVANNVTCTGSPQNFTTGDAALPLFNNIGQTSHLATATSNAVQFQMEIDGIDNIGNVYRLSDLQLGIPSTAKGGLVVTAAGYMPRIRISVTCTAAATFSVSYSGSFSPQPPNIAATLLSSVEKLPFQTAAANATSSITFQTPAGNSSGTIVFQYSATGPAGSSITAQCITNGNTNLATFVFPLSTVSTPQLFNVTQSSCPFVTLTYTSGGASAVTYNLEFVFNVQGTQQGLTGPNTGPASASPLQVIGDTISQAFFTVVAGGVTTNPAAGQVLLSINANSGARSLYFDKVILSCTALCSINVNTTTNNGTGCSALSALNAKLGNPTTSTASAVASACTTTPAFNATININLAAGVPIVFDLKGLIAPSGSTTGMDVTMQTALTGNVGGTVFWYER